MLHVEAIEPDTLELLKRLQRDPALVDTRLVGGTSLALQLGHRKSVDLVLFGSLGMMGSELERALREYGGVELVNRSRAEEDPMPVMLKSLEWDEAKTCICDAVRTTA